MANRVPRFPFRRLDSSLVGDRCYRLDCKINTGQERGIIPQSYLLLVLGQTPNNHMMPVSTETGFLIGGSSINV
jgi:hypothetical protein